MAFQVGWLAAPGLDPGPPAGNDRQHKGLEVLVKVSSVRCRPRGGGAARGSPCRRWELGLLAEGFLQHATHDLSHIRLTVAILAQAPGAYAGGLGRSGARGPEWRREAGEGWLRLLPQEDRA